MKFQYKENARHDFEIADEAILNQLDDFRKQGRLNLPVLRYLLLINKVMGGKVSLEVSGKHLFEESINSLPLFSLNYFEFITQNLIFKNKQNYFFEENSKELSINSTDQGIELQVLKGNQILSSALVDCKELINVSAQFYKNSFSLFLSNYPKCGNQEALKVMLPYDIKV